MLNHCDVDSAECCFRGRLNAVNVLSINNIKILLVLFMRYLHVSSMMLAKIKLCKMLHKHAVEHAACSKGFLI